MAFICPQCDEYFASAGPIATSEAGKISRCPKGHPLTSNGIEGGWTSSGLVSFLIPVVVILFFYILFSRVMLFALGESRPITFGVVIFWICISIFAAAGSVIEVRKLWHFDGYRKRWPNALAARVAGAVVGLAIVTLLAFVRYVKQLITVT